VQPEQGISVRASSLNAFCVEAEDDLCVEWRHRGLMVADRIRSRKRVLPYSFVLLSETGRLLYLAGRMMS
jgi:hypothetical protein